MQKTAEKKNIRKKDKTLKIGKTGHVAKAIVKQNRQFWGRTFKCEEHAEDDSNPLFSLLHEAFSLGSLLATQHDDKNLV